MAVRRPSRGCDARQRARSERGAGIVEYALIFALVVVVMAAGIDRIEKSVGDEAKEKQAIAGSPDVNEVAAPGEVGSTTTVAPTPSTTPPEAGAVTLSLTGSSGISSVSSGRWVATVKVTVVGPDGAAPAVSVAVSGTWSTGASTACQTDQVGSCQMTLQSLKNNVKEVDFTVTAVSGQGVVPPATYPEPIKIAKP